MVKKKMFHRMERPNRFSQFIVAAMVIENRDIDPTVSSICKECGVSVSTHARNIINDIAKSGYLNKYQRLHWNGKMGYIYRVNHDALQRDCPEWFAEKAKLIGLRTRMAGLS